MSNNYITLGHNLLSITSKPEDGVQPYITEKGMFLHIMVKFLTMIIF